MEEFGKRNAEVGMRKSEWEREKLRHSDLRSDDGKQMTEGRCLKTDNRGQMAEDRRQINRSRNGECGLRPIGAIGPAPRREVGMGKSECGMRKGEVGRGARGELRRRQRTDDGGQKTDGRGQKSEGFDFGIRNAK